MCDKRMPKTLKGKVYKTMIRPVMMYGSECWTTKKSDINALGVAEMKMLRWSAGYTRLDRKKNEEIRSSLKVAPIQEKVVSNRLRWFGHVQRRENDHICRKIMTWEVQGKCKRGRPLKNWRQSQRFWTKRGTYQQIHTWRTQ